MFRDIKGPSGTAIAVAAFRAAYNFAPSPLEVVDDPFAARLIPSRPLGRLVSSTQSRPRLGYALHRTLALLSAEMSTNLALRTAAIDDAIREALAREVHRPHPRSGSGKPSLSTSPLPPSNTPLRPLLRCPLQEARCWRPTRRSTWDRAIGRPGTGASPPGSQASPSVAR